MTLQHNLLARANEHPAAMAGMAIVAAVLSFVVIVQQLLVFDFAVRLGVDLQQYTIATQDWLAGRGWLHEWQVAGPYVIPDLVFDPQRLPVLYPPPVILLFLPWATMPVLGPMWWAIPLGIIGTSVRKWRPRSWTWPILVLLAMHPMSFWLVVSGNPVIWASAALALGLRYQWPAVLVLVKPTLAPFALVGITRASWWVALGACVVVSLAFLPMWPDYVRSLLNARTGSSYYLTSGLWLMLLPLIAWLGRQERGGVRGSPPEPEVSPGHPTVRALD